MYVLYNVHKTQEYLGTHYILPLNIDRPINLVKKYIQRFRKPNKTEIIVLHSLSLSSLSLSATLSLSSNSSMAGLLKTPSLHLTPTLFHAPSVPFKPFCVSFAGGRNTSISLSRRASLRSVSSGYPLRLLNLVPFASGEAETTETEVESNEPEVQVFRFRLTYVYFLGVYMLVGGLGFRVSKLGYF